MDADVKLRYSDPHPGLPPSLFPSSICPSSNSFSEACIFSWFSSSHRHLHQQLYAGRGVRRCREKNEEWDAPEERGVVIFVPARPRCLWMVRGEGAASARRRGRMQLKPLLPSTYG
ncbi:hypothetical protein VPH35_026479 [Triticum aestivum]